MGSRRTCTHVAEKGGYEEEESRGVGHFPGSSGGILPFVLNRLLSILVLLYFNETALVFIEGRRLMHCLRLCFLINIWPYCLELNH
jgi:hypothetical protein